ncbi:hypothetical protein VNI00_004202 [Paramarasmius palmivorus]|uniref:F-box domain-containing protein n=1 Tax=Paramarasmius palmivorus TaxID=297713 RepID=A0AAW0DND4_9AGAR
MVKIQTLLKPHKPLIRPKLPELPQEILTEIFTFNVGHGFDWRSEILGCALVSKAWYAAARPVFYSKYALYSPSCLTRFEKRLKRDPAITNLVRRIQVETSVVTDDDQPCPIELRTLPGVQEMTWTNTEPWAVPLQASRGVQQLLGLFPNLRTLHISTPFESIEQLKTFLAYCGPIRGLSLDYNLRFGGASVSTSSLSTPPDAKDPCPRFTMKDLERLEILRPFGSNFDWVYYHLVCESMPKLRSLRIDEEGMSLRVLCLLLKKVSSTLTHLSLDTKELADHRGTYRIPRLYCQHNPFPPLPELQFIAIGTLTTEYWPMNLLDRICINFLGELRAPALRTLQLTLHTPSPTKLVDLLECYNWTLFFTVLMTMFPELSQIVLCIIMEVEFGRAWRNKLEALAVRYVRWKCPCCADKIKTSMQFSVEMLYPSNLQEPFPENPMSDGEYDLDEDH